MVTVVMVGVVVGLSVDVVHVDVVEVGIETAVVGVAQVFLILQQ